MNKRELTIVSAFTGVLLCDFGDLHAYIEAALGRPVFTHELGIPHVQDEIKRAAKRDLLALVKTPGSGEEAVSDG